MANALRLVNAARAASVPIVFVQHCDEVGAAFEEGTAHWELHEHLVPAPHDTLLSKRASSAFEGTDLGSTLAAMDASTLLLCGLQSEFCVFNTAKSALANGFSVMLAQDAHGTWPSKVESAVDISARINRELEEAGAALKSTARLVDLLSSNGARG